MTHFNVTSTYGAVGAAMNFALIMVLYLVNMSLLAEWYVGTLALLIIVVFQFLGDCGCQEGAWCAVFVWSGLDGVDDGRSRGPNLGCGTHLGFVPSHCTRIAWCIGANHLGQISGNDGGIWHEWRHA